MKMNKTYFNPSVQVRSIKSEDFMDMSISINDNEILIEEESQILTNKSVWDESNN